MSISKAAVYCAVELYSVILRGFSVIFSTPFISIKIRNNRHNSLYRPHAIQFNSTTNYMIYIIHPK